MSVACVYLWQHLSLTRAIHLPTSLAIAEFEDMFIDTLSARTARSLIRQNLGTMLAYSTPATPGRSPETRIVDSMA